MRALINVRVYKEGRQFIDVHDFHDVMEQMGLKPGDMPPAGDGDHSETLLKRYFLTRAEPILERIPDNSPEEKMRKERSIANIVYTSELTESNTQFMVTRHTEETYRFRLLNSRIEDLQDGCKDLVLRIKAYNSHNKAMHQLAISGKIKILEHGLEESTISGTVVDSPWKSVRRTAGRDFLLVSAGIIFFLILTLLDATGIISAGSLMHGHVQRLSTAMLTTIFVSLVSIYYIRIQQSPVIAWSVNYERPRET